ncbi:MAG TPA: CBS domain-containing protein [Bryobacteraceae bacterium]|jgi:signal-transduction protein with cAMP-binding, CBS, and nucleotidyltransferase domain|nr:CBS domain-containing protein [Bryobacteraceae bacterium]
MAKPVHLSAALAAGETAVEETVAAILKNKGDQVWQIAPAATVYQAVSEMAQQRIGALPVVDGGTLLGIVTERDYARKIILQGRTSSGTTVQEIMTHSPVTVTPVFTVKQCLRIMTVRRFRHLPVVDDGKLCGMISIGDLVAAVIASQTFTIEQLETYIAADYPG